MIVINMCSWMMLEESSTHERLIACLVVEGTGVQCPAFTTEFEAPVRKDTGHETTKRI